MSFVHGSKLTRKAAEDASLLPILEAYRNWRDLSERITGRSKGDIEELVKYLDQYKIFAEPLLDIRPNSAQEVLQSSILEEFFEYLFRFVERDLVEGLKTGPAAGFIDLVFNPKDVTSLVMEPQ